jgi:hypothetical protein
MLPPSHPGPTMIKIFPETEVGENPEKGLKQMYENGNLQNGIRVQMRQVQLVEINETAEKGGDGKSKPTNKKRNVNDRFMGILCRTVTPRQIRQEQSSLEAKPQLQRDEGGQIQK